MRTQSVETRNAAYELLKASPKMGNQKRLILAFIGNRQDATRQEISVGTMISINAVCGRIGQLIEGGHIEESTPRQCNITRNTVTPLRIKAKAEAVQ